MVTKYDLCIYINDIYNLNINIIPTNDNIYKNMTLIGNKDNLFYIKDIYSQIKAQYDHHN